MRRAVALIICTLTVSAASAAEPPLRVGAAAVNLKADNSMVLAGMLQGRFVTDQEGELRAVAVVIEKPGATKVAIVACDVLWVTRPMVDSALSEIEQKTGIPPANILINATHTHYAPSTAPAHNFGVSLEWVEEVRKGIVKAVVDANDKLAKGDCEFFFKLGEEKTVGANSRLLLPDGNVTWLNPRRESNGQGKPTGPFDPQLPVLDFRDASGKSLALIWNHSTHSLGTLSGGDIRSPSFYGLAAQELERELGGVVSFLEGASGSTHEIDNMAVAERIKRLKAAVNDARSKAEPMPVTRLAAVRRPFKFTVRKFVEAEEDAKVERYCLAHAAGSADVIRKIFSDMRRQLVDHQGEEHETWLQAVLIGDVAIVGVPAEYFTVLGVDIKTRSPFKHTYVAELANDWIGYLPDREGHRLGGYQTWMGLHSYAEIGTGERVADEIVDMLNELKKNAGGDATKTSGKEKRSVSSTGGPQSPEAERQSFRLADPTLMIELVAAEPDISSPVSIAWDAQGRMYVVEMIGYPVTERSGQIRRLEDRDGDGRYEHSTIFASGLNFPTSVMPYRDGVLVTAAPDLLFLRDTDNDGRADESRVEWTGFNPGSQQLRANALHWGIDNFIYGANGRCDGEIQRANSTDAPISIRGRDFRLTPDQARFEAINGQSQFGQAHDDFGNRFLGWNEIPVRYVVMENEQVARAPQFASRTIVNLASPDDDKAVYPLAEPPRQFNSESAHVYNALSGLTILRGDALGPEYRGNAFVGESLSSLVIRRRLVPDSATFRSERVEHHREFLASTDNWFHPVCMANGPDGALYVVDFYRKFVEHPLYVSSQKARDETNWNEGNQFGRIWRIRRRDAEPITKVFSPDAAISELVEALGDPIGWRCDTAQRLLVERQATEAATPLRKLAETGESLTARIRALWTLDGIGQLDDSTIALALEDPDPIARVHALRLARKCVAKSSVIKKLALRLVHDPDMRVRFELAQTLSEIDPDLRIPALAMLSLGDSDEWLQMAVLSSAGVDADQLIVEVLKQSHPAPEKVSREFFAAAAETAARHRAADACGDLVQIILDPDLRANDSLRISLLASVLKVHPDVRPTAESDGAKTVLSKLTPSALAIARDQSAAEQSRIDAIAFLGVGDRDSVNETVRALALGSDSQPVRIAAVRAASKLNDSALAAELFTNWPQLSRQVRQETLIAAQSPGALRTAAIDAIANGVVAPIELPRDFVSIVTASSGPEADILQKFLSAQINADRASIVAQYDVSLTLPGNPTAGAHVFAKNCVTCHVVLGTGNIVGPDLTIQARRPAVELLGEILDPSQRVSPDYLAYTVVTKSGRVESGLIANETASSITLRKERNQELPIQLSDVEEIKALGKSLMPEGLEKSISQQQMADLIAFIHAPDRALLEAACEQLETAAN